MPDSFRWWSAGTVSGALARALLEIDPREVSFERRGFRAASPDARSRLEDVGRAFLRGYSAALRGRELDALAAELTQAGPDAGFAFEGAGMALVLRRALRARPGARLQALLRGAGARHVYTLHVGAGWALARIPWLRSRPAALLRDCDPVLGALVFDGWGFHEGYFRPEPTLRRGYVPPNLSAAERAGFDQGLGRSLWFIEGGSPGAVAQRIAALDLRRHSDLWSGVGLACTYAGGVSREAIQRLLTLTGEHRFALAQGAAFAAEARVLAGLVTPHVELACLLLCGCSAHSAAGLTRAARAELERKASGGETISYEHWRYSVQSQLRPMPGVA